MAIPGTEYYFLGSNHANLGKFQSYDEYGYRKVASVIREMCQKATSLVEKNWGKYQQRNGNIPHHMQPPMAGFSMLTNGCRAKCISGRRRKTR
jgi:hypothetical protein